MVATGPVLVLATFVQLAFLFRHDHGLYIGIAAMAAVALPSAYGNTSSLITRVASFAALLSRLTAPSRR